MGVLFQAFYLNCPAEENQDGTWWSFVASKIPELQQAGITALWLPPACKAANLGVPSMGYDPYDYYDLGDINQKGRLKTWFGNEGELTTLIDAAHTANMQVYADLVINHNNGGDAQEFNPIDGNTRWTKFNPGSGKFLRDLTNFHPSPYETFDDMSFGDMPDLCHRNPHVYGEIITLAQWTRTPKYFLCGCLESVSWAENFRKSLKYKSVIAIQFIPKVVTMVYCCRFFATWRYRMSLTAVSGY